MNQQDYDREREFIEAAAAVYAWVSSADGEITHSEVDSFVEYLNNSPFIDSISEEDFSEMYLTILEAFSQDFDDGKARAEARVEPFRGDETMANALVAVARRALIADKRLTEPEEVVLAEICKLLGINEGSITKTQ